MKCPSDEVDGRACQTVAKVAGLSSHRQRARRLSLISGASMKFDANSEEGERAMKFSSRTLLFLYQGNRRHTSHAGVMCIA